MLKSKPNSLRLVKETVCCLSDDEMTHVVGASALPCAGLGYALYSLYDAGARFGAKMKKMTW